jgi:hypothetical protein
MTIHYCYVCFSLVGTDVTIFWLPYMFLGDSLCNQIDIYCNEEECDLRDLWSVIWYTESYSRWYRSSSKSQKWKFVGQDVSWVLNCQGRDCREIWNYLLIGFQACQSGRRSLMAAAELRAAVCHFPLQKSDTMFWEDHPIDNFKSLGELWLLWQYFVPHHSNVTGLDTDSIYL